MDYTITESIKKRFWDKVNVASPQDCWNWKAGITNKGYGALGTSGGKNDKAHRISWVIHNGKIPKNFCVMHTCNNRLCCNPKHFYLSENGNDSVKWDNSFWSRIKKGSESECWPWIGKSKHHFGYGYYRTQWTKRAGRGKMVMTHRIAYELAFGKIPDGLYVLHKCDNPPCCNPSHLFIGTAHDNMQDCINKGRKAVGVNQGGAKITDSIVRIIRQTYKFHDPQNNANALGKRFGIWGRTALDIAKGKSWKHVV